MDHPALRHIAREAMRQRGLQPDFSAMAQQEAAERQVRKPAAALLLASRVGQTFNAFVTGVSSKGTWVRIPAPVAEGCVVRGFEGLDVGDKPRVMLVGVDAARGFVDFEKVG